MEYISKIPDINKIHPLSKKEKMKKYIVFVGLVLAFCACNEAIDFGLEGELPTKPEFRIESVEGDPNSFVVTDLSEGNFSRVWEFRGGAPATSTLKSDTVFYNKAGDYNVSLHVASESGSGTAFSTKIINVEADVAGCQLLFLNEDCSRKCWRLSGEPGSVRVGPIPYSGEWYTSPDITSSQADDRWCFNEDGIFEYENFGSTFSSCLGFVDIEDYDIPADMTYSFIPGAGQDGLDRIQLSALWMGVEDSGNTYDIIEISEDEMMMLTPLKPCDGSPSTGWFTLVFFKAE